MSLPMLFCNIELKIYVPDGFEGKRGFCTFVFMVSNLRNVTMTALINKEISFI
jgi:hypothetical protein